MVSCLQIRLVLLVLLFNSVMHCIISTIVVALEINIYLSIYLLQYATYCQEITWINLRINIILTATVET